MTYSITAYDPASQALGIATATGNLAVGGFVPHLKAGVGAIATQGFSTNFNYGVAGLQLLAQGRSAEQAVEQLQQDDLGRDYRQCIAVDVQGGSGGWTGPENHDAMGHRCAPNLAVAGNFLAGQEVLAEMEASYARSAVLPFAERLLGALEAGYRAGGDHRGTTSAALKVVWPEELPIDLRVDFSPQAVPTLRELYQRTQDAQYQAFLHRLPTAKAPHRY